MRHLATALLLVFLTVCPSLAQGNGNGNGNGGDNGSQNSQGDNAGGNSGNGNAGNSGNGNAGNNGNGNAGNNGNGNAGNNGNGNAGNNGNGNAGNNGNGNAGNNGNGSSQGSGSSNNGATTDADGTVHFSQEYAREAASAGRIVGLSSLMSDLQVRSSGQVIDAELLQVRGFLVYSIRVLRADGKVTTEFYYAQSGRYIGSQP